MPKKPGKPKIQQSIPVPDIVIEMAKIHCTNNEIAAMIDIDPSNLSKPPYAALIAKGKDLGKHELRQSMWKNARNGNVVMQIWLSKQHLGMTDKVESDNKTKVDINIIHDSQWADGTPTDTNP